MPLLKIQTNQPCSENQQKQLLSEASQLVAQQLGKQERYVMVAIEPPVAMSFAGDTDACAYLELKSIGLPESKTRDLSDALCRLVECMLDIEKERIYIEFADAPRAMWGWNGSTF
jgi:phenylpyruvate tautomerase PptA (4-oxalocrotonate tautomerase family)